MRYHTIGVKHNIEVAHRLSLLPGKCENIHGHSMWVTLELEGALNNKGILEGIEFGDLKHLFREHLDTEYDHHLLLNQDDPWARPVMLLDRDSDGRFNVQTDVEELPGLKACPGDPTTENIALWIGNYMEDLLREMVGDEIPSMNVIVWETSVNKASFNIDNTIE